MEIVREITGDKISSPQDVYKYLEEFKNQDREHLIVIGLDSNNSPCYREIVAIGTLNSTLFHPREIFKKAIIMSANSIIVAHNHPSGNLEPSEEDLRVSKRLNECGELLGIKVLDNLAISSKGYKSINEVI